MNKKIFILIASLAIIAVVIVLVILYYRTVSKPLIIGNGGVTFQLIDGDTKQPVPNKKITICDDSIKIFRVPGGEYKGFCNDQKIWGYVTTDKEGKFSLDVKSINIVPPTAIMIDPGKEYYAIDISRSNTLAHNFHPSYIRVLNKEKSGHVVSNRLYNFDTKETKEIFTNGDPDKVYAFDVIDIIAYKISN